MHKITPESISAGGTGLSKSNSPPLPADKARGSLSERERRADGERSIRMLAANRGAALSLPAFIVNSAFSRRIDAGKARCWITSARRSAFDISIHALPGVASGMTRRVLVISRNRQTIARPMMKIGRRV